MKRSEVVVLLAGGVSLAGIFGYTELSRCEPDAAGAKPAMCSDSGHSGSGGGSHAYSSSTSRGGFGATGAAHAGGGS
jgi:hypothetical protein